MFTKIHTLHKHAFFCSGLNTERLSSVVKAHLLQVTNVSFFFKDIKACQVKRQNKAEATERMQAAERALFNHLMLHITFLLRNLNQ